MSEHVRRWDIYDIADELEDVPCMILQAMASGDQDQIFEAVGDIKGLIKRLWAAAGRDGRVGPSPFYASV